MAETKSGTFPIRCAGMDVGSNAIRLAIAEFKSPTRYKILERKRVPVRLGESVFQTSRIALSPYYETLPAERAGALPRAAQEIETELNGLGVGYVSFGPIRGTRSRSSPPAGAPGGAPPSARGAPTSRPCWPASRG